MNVQQVDYILAVAELRHFGLAAEKCNITQSTISTMVSRFEEELGLQLFDRKTKPITITLEGEEVIKQLSIIREELGVLKEKVQELKGEGRGELRIGVIPTIGPYLLPLFLHDFVQMHPDIQFEVSEITTEQIVQDILNRRLDIGIVSIPLRESAIREVFLYDEPFLCYDPQKDKQGGTCQVKDLDYDRLWLLEEGHCMRTQVEKICAFQEARRLSRNLDYKSATIHTLIKLVKKSMGMTLLPFLSTIDLTARDRSHLYHFETPIPCRSVGLIAHQYFAKRTLLESLQQHIEGCIATKLPEVKGPYRAVDPL